MSIETMHILRKVPSSTPLFAELSVVALARPIETDDGSSVPEGSYGTVVAVYGGGAAYEVEFAYPVAGNATVEASDLRAA